MTNGGRTRVTTVSGAPLGGNASWAESEGAPQQAAVKRNASAMRRMESANLSMTVPEYPAVYTRPLRRDAMHGLTDGSPANLEALGRSVGIQGIRDLKTALLCPQNTVRALRGSQGVKLSAQKVEESWGQNAVGDRTVVGPGRAPKVRAGPVKFIPLVNADP